MIAARALASSAAAGPPRIELEERLDPATGAVLARRCVVVAAPAVHSVYLRNLTSRGRPPTLGVDKQLLAAVYPSAQTSASGPAAPGGRPSRPATPPGSSRSPPPPA